MNALRFSYFALEDVFTAISKDRFSSDKAIIVLGASQVAAAFSIMNALILSGLQLPTAKLGWAISIGLGILLVLANGALLGKQAELQTSREAYEEIPKSMRLLGGIAILVATIILVGMGLVTSAMVADLRAGPVG